MVATGVGAMFWHEYERATPLVSCSVQNSLSQDDRVGRAWQVQGHDGDQQGAQQSQQYCERLAEKGWPGCVMLGRQSVACNKLVLPDISSEDTACARIDLDDVESADHPIEQALSPETKAAH